MTGLWLDLYFYSLEGPFRARFFELGLAKPSFWRNFLKEFLPLDSLGQKNCRTGNKDGWACFLVPLWEPVNNLTEIIFQLDNEPAFSLGTRD
jgi:hypothetical protein